MVSHAEFLRPRWEGEDGEFLAMVRASRDLGNEVADLPQVAAAERAVERVDDLPGLDQGDRAMLRFVARLTLSSRSMRKQHTRELRDAGFDETGVHDIVGVASNFAFMNRLADGLGVTVPESRYELARELFGDESLQAHLAWSRGDEVD